MIVPATSTRDALSEGFGVRILADLTPGISPESTATAFADLRGRGAEIVGGVACG